MRKLFTLTLALLASFSLWANYAPTADEIIILNNIKTSSSPYSSHAAISWLSSPASSNSKKAGDPNNNGAATSSNVACYSVKGNSGKEILVSIEGCSQIIIYHESHASRYIELRDGSKTGALIGAGVAATYFTAVDLNANNQYSIFLHGTAGSDDQDLYVYAIKLIKGTTCSDPAEELALNLSKTTDIYAGDVITVGHTGGNGSTVSYTLDGAPFNAASWTATEGEHTFAISQDAAEVESVLTCGGSDEVVLNVVAAEAVEEVSIAGVTSAYVGAELTYTATAANATAYEWYLDGVKQGSDSAKFIYTAVKGNHTIVCKARNTFNLDPEWISSDAKALTVTNPSGTLIAATAETSGSNIDKNITATGIVGGTVHQKTQKNAKLGSEGHYYSLTLASGSFQDGDTVKVVVTPEYNSDKKTYSAPSQLKISTTVGNTNLIGASETKTIDPASSADLYFDIVLSEGASTIYLARDGSICKQNPIVKSIAVVRPKEVKSVTETLSNVKIDGEAISSANLTTLLADESLDIAESYLDAPEVKFYKNIRTTYEDDTYSDKLDSIVVTSTTEAGKWQAQATINEVEYTVTMAKTASFVVTYMFGSTELGTENVESGSLPANYATYQTLNDGNLSTFNAWYSKSDLSGDAVTIASATITKDTTFYASFTYKYATSINIESLILANGKSYNTKGQLGSRNYASNYSSEGMDISNDSLNNGKGAYRNYDYLGLKVKSVSLLNFRIANGKTVKMKFGDVKTTPQVSINGGDYAAITITDGVYTHTAEAEELISFKVTEGNKAVVIKQIVIGDAPELEDVAYAINYAATINGTVSGWTIALPGETVTLTLAPASGYRVASVKVNDGDPLTVTDNTASFEMPAAAANVVAAFELATALDNTADEIKAVKFIENGQLFIRRGEKVYTITGEEVK